MDNEIKRNYKDSMFRKLFDSEDKIRELYNALENTNYGPETPVEIKTLDDVIFRDIKDDLAFTIDGKFVVLIEHQSTINCNMPVRMLSYLARVYEKMFTGMELYRKRIKQLPFPEFFVLYNGAEDYPSESTLKLSDAFARTGKEINAELIVKVFNLAYNENTELLKRSETLRQYSKCISYVNAGIAGGLSSEEAVKRAIALCRKEGCVGLAARTGFRGVTVCSISAVADTTSEKKCDSFRLLYGHCHVSFN